MDISSSIISLQPGLYVLRHPKTAGLALSVSRAPDCMAKVDILSTPNTHGTLLRNGADCIVMLISHTVAQLLVTAIQEQPSALAPALKIDQIALDATSPVAALAEALPKAAVPAPVAEKALGKSTENTIEIGPNGLTIIGHVERVGDVVAAEGEVLGNPQGTQRVEGFQLMWPDRPAGVDLAYNISVEGFGATPVVKTGKFCGTRGEARRITEVTFTLIGPDAEKFKLDGLASFSGGFQIPVESGIPLGGPSGIEHLTAISLRPVINVASQKNPWNDTAKTKVFKAKPVASTATKKVESKKADTRAAKTK